MSVLPSERPAKQFKSDWEKCQFYLLITGKNNSRLTVTQCEKCMKRRSAISQLKGINRHLKNELRRAKEKVSETRQLGQSVKRKTVITNTLRTKMRTLAADNLKKCRQIQKLKKQNAQLQDNLDQKKGMRLKWLNSKLRCQQQKHQSTCNDLRKQVRNLELVNDNLTAELEDVRADDNIISMKIDGKMYGPAVRKAAYHCLSNQVPVETTCHVIRSVVKDYFCGDDGLPTKSNNSEPVCI